MAIDAFISYSSHDREQAMALTRGLREMGFVTWVDKEGIGGSRLWAEEIVRAIDACRIVLFLASQSSVASHNVVKEIALASESRKLILPLFLEPVEVPPTLKYQLAGIQHLELFQKSLEENLRQIRHALEGQGIVPGGRSQVSEAGIGGSDATARDVERAIGRLKPAPHTLRRPGLQEEIVRCLTAGPLPALLLQGLGGTGKSALLCDAARDMAGAFPNFFAVNLDGPAALEPGYLIEELQAFLESVGRKVDADRMRSRPPERNLETLVAALGDMKLLVLLDPLDAVPADWLRFMFRTFAAAPGVRVLAAARARPDQVADCMQVFYVPPLQPAEAHALVARLAQGPAMDVDAPALLRRLPPAIATHPAALTMLMAQLHDFPLEMLLGQATQDLMPEACSPAQLIQQLAARHGEAPVRVLASLDTIGEMDVQAAFAALRMAPLPGLLNGLQVLLNRSLVYRSGPGYAVPPVVSEALAHLNLPAAEELLGQIATAWRTAMESLISAGNPPGAAGAAPAPDAGVLAALGSRAAYHLWKSGRYPEVLAMAREDLLEQLNLRGFWKEYSLLLRLGTEAAQQTGDRTAQVRLGLRLVRKSLQMGDAPAAAALLEQTAALLGSGGTPLEQAELHSHRAAMFQARHEEDAALRELSQSRRIRQDEGDRAGLATVEKLIGNLYLRRLDHASARRAFESAIALTDRPGDKTVIEAQTSLALCDLADHLPADAEKRLRAVLEACRSAHYHAGAPRALLNLALALGNQGRTAEALEAATDAAARSSSLDPQLAKVAARLAERFARKT